MKQEEAKDFKQTLSALCEQHDLCAVAQKLGKERVQLRRWCKRFNGRGAGLVR